MFDNANHYALRTEIFEGKVRTRRQTKYLLTSTGTGNDEGVVRADSLEPPPQLGSLLAIFWG